MALEVIGVGWGRTGTLSMKLALERLGFDPCYHMVEAFAHEEDFTTWQRALDGGDVDWPTFLADYRSGLDWPLCAFWREILDAHPDARVLLTDREPTRWWESFEQTILAAIATFDAPEATATQRTVAAVVRRSFGGEVRDRDRAIDAYRRHRDEVRATVTPGRLLVTSVADGWAPLCAHLGVAEPDEPFPRVNERGEFGAAVAEHVARAQQRPDRSRRGG